MLPTHISMPTSVPAGNIGTGSQSIVAIDFLKALFAQTDEPQNVCSFSNDRDDPKQVGERHVITRTPGQITSFVEKWDKPGRGLFFCVGTVKTGVQRRAKENIAETVGLDADLDFNKIDGLPSDTSAARAEVLRQIARLKHQPTATVFSGNGVHAYWLFNEPLATQENIDRIEMALRQLADVVAGDLAVCEVARVLRMPGSHNTKNDAWSEVEITSFDPECRYELDDLEEWLAEQSPLMLREQREQAVTVGETEFSEYQFFIDYAKKYGIKPPIDVEARPPSPCTWAAATPRSTDPARGHRVAAQQRHAEGRCRRDRARCHQEGGGPLWRALELAARRAQLVRDVRLVAQEASAEREAQDHAEGRAAQHRGRRHGDAQRTPQQEQHQQPAIVGAQVIQMPQPKPTVSKKSEHHIVLGQAVLAHMRASGEELINIKGGAWFYSAGIWELYVVDQWLNVRIEQACAGLGFKSVNKLINETRQWILRQPQLWRKDPLPWDQHGKIPTRSGLIDPLTGELEPARPDHFCAWRVEVEYDPAAKCNVGETMVGDILATVRKRSRLRWCRLCRNASARH